VDAKIGETASVGKSVISLNSLQKYQVEIYVAEPDLSKVKVGDAAKVSLDAYGTGVNFDANVISIDPAATMVKNIPSYKVTLEFKQDDDRIRSGMNASIIASNAQPITVLAAPTKSIMQDEDKKFVLVKQADGKTIQKEIQTGVSGNNGYTEIKQGLSEGDNVANFGN
jgi:hypothetical protein